jgi:hypothetical protein
VMTRSLLEAGADPDIETPANGQNFPHANNETQHWTALTFASLMGNGSIGKVRSLIVIHTTSNLLSS